MPRMRMSKTIKASVSLDLGTIRACLDSAQMGCQVASWAKFVANRIEEQDGHGLKPRRARWPLADGVIRNGLEVMAAKAPASFAALLNGRFDANTGDALIQCAVLGEVRYG